MSARNIHKEIVMILCSIVGYFTGAALKPAILMYHSFDGIGWKHGVSPKNLEKQFVYLKKKKEVVTLLDIITYVKNEKEIPKNTIAITVDDGYEDTYTILYPLAKKYNFPFTLFLTTDLSILPKLGNLPRPTWEQLKEMSDSGLVDVQVHGHSHVNFPEIFENGIEADEIEICKTIIWNKLGSVATIVAYPAGNYNKRVLKYFRTKKYVAGCTTRQGFVQSNDDPLQLNRIPVDRATTMPLFRLRLTAGYPIYLSLVHGIRKKYE